MKGRGFLTVSIGVVAGVLALAAACAPASQTNDGGSGGNTSGGGTSTPTPASSSNGGGTPVQQTASVNGMPLDAGAKYGGVLLTAATGEGPTLNTWEEAAGNSFNIVHPVSNMLVQPQSWGTEADYTSGAIWNLKPDLARSWEQSPDGKQWTFKLYDGVKWSDGTPLTCADVKYTFDTIRSGDGLLRSPRAVHFLAVDDITCPDDLTVVFHLNRPKASLLSVIAVPQHVVRPKHIYESNPDALREEVPTVGTGPFVIKDRIPGEKTTFERKADYWNQPLPYLNGLEMLILNAQSQVSALRAGRLDIGTSGGNWNGARANTLVNECSVCQVWPRAMHPGQLFSLIPNQERAPWNTPEIKNALSLAIDRNKVLSVGYEGWGRVATGGLYLPDSEWAMPYERVKQIPGYDFENVEANQAQARQLLADAGYAPGELKLDVTYSVGSLNYEPYAITMIEDLNKVGIAATPKPLDTALYYDVMGNGGFDVGGHAGWIGGFDPDFILYEYFYSGSDRNYGRYSNAEFDRLVDEQSQTIDLEARREKAWQASEIALRDQARIFVGWQEYQPIFAKRVQGWMPGVPSQAGYGSWLRFEHAWISE